MRLVTMRTARGLRAARLDGDAVTELGHHDVGALLAAGSLPATPSTTPSTGQPPPTPLADVELAPVVPAPSKIICLGLNYRSHLEEMGIPLPGHPTLFAKFREALIGPRDPIVLPDASAEVDWEAELGVVIGRRVRHAGPEEAADAIAGFTIVNDVTMRDWQRRTSEWLQGKTFEATTPVGPALVTPDEVGGTDPDLLVRCEVDGMVVQEARTSELVFKPVDIIAYVSTIVTLEPGDLISTGTPGGVGAARQPPVFLRAGQVVRTAIEGLGELVNECVREGR